MFDQENPYLGFGLTEAHVAEREKYMILWVKDGVGIKCHSLCRKRAPAANADAGPETDTE
ncbi:MAG: hypothetical protein ACKPKO_33380 [Candidatus Fonsibacter sp.]